MRSELLRLGDEYAAAGQAKALSLMGTLKGSPESLFGWLSSGVLLQPLRMSHHEVVQVDFERTEIKACFGDSCGAGGLTEAKAASFTSWIRSPRLLPWLASRQTLLRLLKSILPSDPNGFLIFLYGQARDAACVGGNALGIWFFIVAPFLLCAFAVAFVLPV